MSKTEQELNFNHVIDWHLIAPNSSLLLDDLTLLQIEV